MITLGINTSISTFMRQKLLRNFDDFFIEWGVVIFQNWVQRTSWEDVQKLLEQRVRKNPIAKLEKLWSGLCSRSLILFLIYFVSCILFNILKYLIFYISLYNVSLRKYNENRVVSNPVLKHYLHRSWITPGLSCLYVKELPSC